MSSEGPDWFRSPARAFRTAAFWFWHRIPDAREIRDQLADMQAKGIGTVMIQSRPALGLELHLSPEYLVAYRLAAREMQRLGLGLTVYDEYGWMSGHGGGRTVLGADHLRERHLFWTSRPAEGTRTVLTVSNIRAPFLDFLGDLGRDWLYEGGAARWGDWRTAMVVAHPPEIRSVADIRVLMGPVQFSELGASACRLVVDHADLAPGTVITAFASARCLTSRLINYLLPEAAQRFAEVVYAPLVEAAEGIAEAIFFDHPHAGFYIWDEQAGALGNSLLSDGEPVPENEAAALLATVRDIGPETAALRAGYLETYGHRLHAAFFGTLSEWTAARDLGFTGHELLTHVGGWSLHGGLTGFDPRVMPGVDYFGIDRYRSETTVDAADYAPQLAAKLGDSIARAHGRHRCAVEQYSTGRPAGRPTLAGRWDLTAAEFRAQAIRHHLFGARRIILHAVNVTDGVAGDNRLLANPRFDFPPAFNFQPWWDDCPALFQELSRLSAFLEDGTPLRHVALLYPLESIRVSGPDHDCGTHFGLWAEALSRAGIGFDIVDEAMLSAALAPGTDYQALILPDLTAFCSQASVDDIVVWVRRGGHLLASGSLSTGVRDSQDHVDFRTLLSESSIGAGRLTPVLDIDAIPAAISAIVHPEPWLRFEESGPTWCAVARYDKVWRIAVFNDMPFERRLLVVTGGRASDVRLWDLRTGPVTQLTAAEMDEPLCLIVEAEAVICLTLHIAQSSGETTQTGICDPPAASPQPLEGLALSDGWTFEADGSSPRPIAVDRGWEQQGWPTFSGTGIYRRGTRLPQLPQGDRWELHLPEFRDTAELWIDGDLVGRHLAGRARFLLPRHGVAVDMELRVRNTAANRYYAGTGFAAPVPSGLVRPPILVQTSASVATPILKGR